MARLGERILEEGGVRLVGLRDAERRLRHQLDGQRGEDGADLPQLAGIARREDQLHRPSALFWCPMSREMPACASSSSASSSLREKASPSAVPCTSTKCPAAVMTTFMSQPHAESSR